MDAWAAGSDGHDDNAPQDASLDNQAPPVPAVPTWEFVTSMYSSMVRMQEAAHESTVNQRHFGEQLSHITNHLQNLSIPQPAASVVPAPPPIDPTVQKGTPKFNPPRVFTGKGADVEPFISEIKAACYLQRGSLPTVRDKITFVDTYLGQGNPKLWYAALPATDKDALLSFENLLDAFRKRFGDPDIADTALNKLKTMKQGDKPATSYESRFREQLQYLNLSDDTKIIMFYDGLHEEVKDGISQRDTLPTVFDQYTAIVSAVDARVQKRRRERIRDAKDMKGSKPTPSRSASHYTPPPPTPTPSHSTPAGLSSALPPGEPMEIDATKTKRGPLTEDERERRRREGLCGYCGLGKHSIDSCPNMSARAKKNFAARRNDKDKASPSSGKA